MAATTSTADSKTSCEGLSAGADPGILKWGHFGQFALEIYEDLRGGSIILGVIGMPKSNLE